MKRALSLFILLFVTTILFAQVSKTVTCTAGALSSLLTATEKSTITDLTITGTIDARDFKTMRDSMPVLESIDLREVRIAAYTGTEGTVGTTNLSYPADGIPDVAFCFPPTYAGKTSLEHVVLPLILTSIGNWSFSNDSISTIIFPQGVTNIGPWAFYNCKKINNINLPSSVTTLGNDAFHGCTNLSSVEISQNITELGRGVFRGCGFSSIRIPDWITSIGEQAFSECSDLVSATIPSSVTSIGSAAFQYCLKLDSVTFSDRLTTIGAGAFIGCSGIAPLFIPASVKSIEINAFQGWSGLISVDENNQNFSSSEGILFNKTQSKLIFSPVSKTGNYKIPSTVSQIGESAFFRCKGLISIEIPSSVTKIEGGAFINCNGLTSIFAYSESPVDLSKAWSVFDNVNKSTCTLYVPIGTKSVYQVADEWKEFENIIEFVNCKAGQLSTLIPQAIRDTLTTLKITGTIDARDFVTIRDSMPELLQLDLSDVSIVSYSGTLGPVIGIETIYEADAIPQFAFDGSIYHPYEFKLTSIELPHNTVAIKEYAFSNCGNIKDMVFHSSLLTIGRRAFVNCIGLEKIDFPNNLKIIEAEAFSSCANLITINFPDSLNSIEEWTFSACWNLTSLIIPPHVKAIKDFSFFGCSRLVSVNFTIPSSLKLIGSRAFEQCYLLESVNFPASLDSIGSRAFFDCSSLKSINLPLSMTVINEETFSGCSQVEELIIPTSVKSIGKSAFSVCVNLKKLKIPDSVLFIGESAFSNCTGLDGKLELPPSITSIEDYTFYQCSSLDSLIIPSNVIKIGDWAFGGCDGLKYISFPSLITTIGDFSFAHCHSLKGTLTIPYGFTTLEAGAFYYCSFLDTLVLPPTIESIGDYVFDGCVELDAIIVKASLPIDLGKSSNVFRGVEKSMCILNVPYGSKKAYQSANQWQDFQHIVEMPGVLVDTTATIGAEWGSRDSVIIQTNTSWRVSSDSPWLTVTPTEGNSNDTLVFVAKGNPITSTRTAHVTVSGDSIESKIITVLQDAGTGSAVPEDYVLADSTVQIGQMPCFNAYDTITVAGDGSLVEFHDGSSVELIAGSTIRFLPGFHAFEGSFTHALITTDGTFCDGASGAIVENPQQEKSGDEGIILSTGDAKDVGMELKVYPNPNSGRFSIELLKAEVKAEVKVYNALGEMVYQSEVQYGQSNIDLSGARRGLYVVMVSDGKERVSRRVMVE